MQTHCCRPHLRSPSQPPPRVDPLFKQRGPLTEHCLQFPTCDKQYSTLDGCLPATLLSPYDPECHTGSSRTRRLQGMYGCTVLVPFQSPAPSQPRVLAGPDHRGHGVPTPLFKVRCRRLIHQGCQGRHGVARTCQISSGVPYRGCGRWPASIRYRRVAYPALPYHAHPCRTMGEGNSCVLSYWYTHPHTGNQTVQHQGRPLAHQQGWCRATYALVCRRQPRPPSSACTVAFSQRSERKP